VGDWEEVLQKTQWLRVGGGWFSPSPLRGEGRDEEWFDSEHNAANLTPALSLKRRGSN